MWEQASTALGDKSGDKLNERIKMIFTILIVAVVPIIVFYKNINNKDDNFFSYYKLLFWFICLIILFINQVLSKKDILPVRSFYRNELIVISFFILVSFIFCRFKNWAIFGSVDRMTGYIFYLCLIGTVYLVSTMSFTAIQVRQIVKAFLISAFIISIISIMQFYGFDIFNTGVVKHIILGKYYNQLHDKISLFSTGSTSYSTMMNPNYLGGYMALAYPMSFYFAVINKNKIYVFVNQFIFCSLIFSMTRGAWVSAILAVLMTFLFIYDKIDEKLKHKVLKGILINAVVLIMSFFLRINSFSRLLSIFDYQGYFNFLIFLSCILYLFIFRVSIAMSDIKVNINIKGQRFMKFINYIVVICIFLLTLNLLSKGALWQFGTDIIGKAVSDNKFLSGGSNRVVIWVNTIPVLLHTLLFGNGADTLIFYFNQNGLMVKELGFSGTIIDKPHNTYFEIWCDLGFMASITFFIMSIRSLKQKFINTNEPLNICMAAGCLGWIFQAFTNDFFIGVASVYVIFLSLSID